MPVCAREFRDTDYFVKKCVSRGEIFPNRDSVLTSRLPPPPKKIKTDREEALGVKASEACLSTSL